MNSESTTIITPEWVAPVAPQNVVLTATSVVIAAAEIVALLPSETARLSYPDAQETVLPGHLLTPGFVNVHGHAAMTLLRGVADDRDMMDWLTNWIWPIEAKLVDEQFVYDGTRLAALEMLRTGTTCAADTYFFPEQSGRAFTDMGMRAQIGLPVLQFANAWADGEEEHVHKGLAFRDSVKNSQLLTTAFAPHAPYTVTDNGFERVRLYAEQLDMPIHLHLHETATEIDDALRDTGVRPITRLEKLGILQPGLQAIHMTQLREDEMELMARTGVQVAHCPESNMKLASGTCPVTDLLDLGINVAIGTDGAASNNDLDLLQEVRTASLLAKLSSADATKLNAHTALAMLTINGAKFLGLQESIGSIEAGKLADLTAIDLSEPSKQPVYDPISQLIYASSGHQVSHVWVNGEARLQNGQATQANASQISTATEDWRNKISEVLND